MFAVIFEVQPKKERWNDYLDLGKFLKPRLEAIEGFIDNERFSSKRTEGRLLSLSTWRDEKAVVRWRIQEEHHVVQEKGRLEIFEDYHLRVGEVTDDSAPPKGLSVEQKRFDETEIGAAKVVTITELTPAEGSSLGAGSSLLPAYLGLDQTTEALVDHEVYESIYNPGKLLVLASWRSADAAQRWTPSRPDQVASLRHRRVRVIRDYGMFERREAPQFYPEIKPSKHMAA
jgi:heme-degrading monooxygenase HmoA